MFKKIINTFGTKCLGAILNFAIAAVISQAVGDVGKGEQSLLLTTITFILIFSDIVSGASLVYLTPKHKFSRIFIPSYLWSILVGLVAAATLPLFQHGVDTMILVHIGLLSVLASVSAANVNILIGQERVQAANYLNLWQPIAILSTLCVCYFGFDMLNIQSYIIALYVAYGGSWIGGIVLFRKEFREFERCGIKAYRDVLRDLFKYGFLNQAAHFVQFFNFRLCYYLLPLYIDKGSTGVFSNAVSLAEAIWIISRSISLVQYARISNSQDTRYAQKLTIDLTKVCLTVSGTAIFLLACFPTAFYVWFFGPEFSEVAWLVRILAPGTLLYSLSHIFEHYYSGIGKYEITIYSAFCGLCFTILLGFGLIPHIGVYGAAISTSAAYAANGIFLLVIFLKESQYKLKDIFLTKTEMHQYTNDVITWARKIGQKDGENHNDLKNSTL